MRISCFVALCALAVITVPAVAQTTQGMIRGRIVDGGSGTGIANAPVEYTGAYDGQHGRAVADVSGYYVLPLLSPGTYRVRASAPGYQPQEVHELELPVATMLEMNFRLRPLADVWEQGVYRDLRAEAGRAVVRFFGPDLDPSRVRVATAVRPEREGLEPSVSDVVGPVELGELPLAGRDAYTMLALVAGVASDAATARGLGLSVNGQRPSASNFLLDGIENNNYVLSGPLTPVAPEALGEYRVSLNNFSAEYGRTAGVLANAVTRAGGGRWHGLFFYHLKNESLNANGFQENRSGTPRAPLKEAQPGFSVAGPLRRGMLFASWSLEHLRSRSRDTPVSVNLPTTAYRLYTAPGSTARRLLDSYAAPLPVSSVMPTADVTLAPPVTLNRWLSMARVDHHFRGGTQRLFARLLVARLSRPDFIWSPYPDFTSGLENPSTGVAFGLAGALRPNLTHELRAGVNDDDLHWDRAHSDIPTLTTMTGTLLPGSPAFYAYRSRTRNYEFSYNLMSVRSRHVLKAGGGLLLRRMSGQLTAGRDSRYLFRDFLDFGADWPRSFETAVTRTGLPALSSPDYRRQYRNDQFSLFAQDSWQVRPQLVVNGGVRYESFGVPHNSGGTSDTVVEFGTGGTIEERLATARIYASAGEPYQADRNNIAARAGFSWSLSADGHTVLRGAFGVFYDRPFDNLWQNLRSNRIVLVSAPLSAVGVNYLIPVSTALDQFGKTARSLDFPEMTVYQPGIRDAYVESYFAGFQRRLSDTVSVELNGQGSLGRKLITTDKINRPGSTAASVLNPAGRWNTSLTTLSYRANQGLSNYHALTLLCRHRSPSLIVQAAYTWSHSIDNQSDPLLGDFFDLAFTRTTYAGERSGVAAFTRQFDSRGDRGNSDFDQRHSLTGLVSWDTSARFRHSPFGAVLRGWRLGAVAAARTGFPYSVYAASAGTETGAILYNNRADMVSPISATSRTNVPGGVSLLSADAFSAPGNQLGNTGRNAFRGPGMFSADVSLGRSLPLPFAGETVRVTVRADVFNVLNHANLNNPETSLGSADFGVALYGREGRSQGFPALVPFRETARQFQIMLKLEF